jgi:hypothetical protein
MKRRFKNSRRNLNCRLQFKEEFAWPQYHPIYVKEKLGMWRKLKNFMVEWDSSNFYRAYLAHFYPKMHDSIGWNVSKGRLQFFFGDQNQMLHWTIKCLVVNMHTLHQGIVFVVLVMAHLVLELNTYQCNCVHNNLVNYILGLPINLNMLIL